MSVKYRVRLQNDRVVGPFTAEEIGELFLKKHIYGDELCQQFPIGDWRALVSFPSLNGLINQLKKQNLTSTNIERQTDDIIPKNQIQKEPTLSGVKTFNEFKFGREITIDVDYGELEKKYQDSNPPEPEKTRVVSPFKTDEQEIEKTVVIPFKAQRPIKESTEMRSNRIEEEKHRKNIEIQKQPTREELANEKTEFVNLANILPSINAQLSVSEVELEQKAKIEENNERMRLKELQERLRQQELMAEEEEDESFEGPENLVESSVKKSRKKKKRGMSIIVALAFMGIFYVLLTPDPPVKKTGPLFIDIKFPVTQEYEDKTGAETVLVVGRNSYNKGTYVARSIAATQYVLSLQKMFTGNDALGDLILAYSELMEESKDPKISANTIYKLIQLAENKMLSDLNVVTGIALFYNKIRKYQTGVNVVKNYMRAKSPVSSKLLAYYIELLINANDLVEARKIYTKLKETPQKPFEVYYYLARFNDVVDQPAEAQNMIEEGLKYYPASVMLMLKQADYLFKAQDQKKYEEVLKKIIALNSENSPTFTAKAYYHMGLLSAMKNKNKEAAVFFKKSLEIKDSDELRSLLSSLDGGGGKWMDQTILESKVQELIKKSKAELKNGNLEAAFTYSIEAVDAMPEYVPAILLQTQLHFRRGLFDSAISSLQKAISTNPNNNILKKNLVLAYLKSYKFEDAQKILVELSQSKFAYGNEYASLMGDFYFANSNLPLAIRWYSEALNRDPLSDYDMFQISKIFVRVKKFADAKKRLAKALLLDPRNSEYLALNSEIIFEQDNTDTAIGYLRDAISEIGEDPKLLSTIAVLYYKSGQIKEFQNYYKRIQEMPKKDEAFFEFLIYASRLEEQKDNFINYSRELLRLNPGNLKVRLALGEFLFEQRRYPEAILEFEEIKDKLVSYPKVHYMLAKIYLATGDIKKAKVMANKELELNPSLDSAYFIVGEVARTEKDYREAVLKYEKAISLNPKSIDALMSMAWIRLSQNYANEAVELYNRALREDKNNPEIHKQMGYAYKAAGRRALAREKFEDYLKLSPGAADREQVEAQIRNLQ